MKESELFVILKNEGAVDYSRHRNISIMSQMSNIILKVFNERFKNKVKESVEKVQFGFKTGLRKNTLYNGRLGEGR